jgi:hypothetical protein
VRVLEIRDDAAVDPQESQPQRPSLISVRVRVNSQPVAVIASLKRNVGTEPRISYWLGLVGLALR